MDIITIASVAAIALTEMGTKYQKNKIYLLRGLSKKWFPFSYQKEMDGMIDVDAFLSGMKPALYGNTGSPTMMNNMDKLQRYPCVTNGIDIFDGPDFFLFFQDDTKKNDFLNRSKNIPPRSPEFHRLLGESLGYPPKAAAFYAACQANESLYDYSIGIMYGGNRCVSHIDDSIVNAVWLWDRYTDDKDLRIQIDGNHHPVERYDLDRLREIQETHKQRVAATA